MTQRTFQSKGSGSLANKTLALFFTKGMSLEAWERQGILEREVKLYRVFASEFKEILFFSYGGRKEKEYSVCLPKNILVVARPVFLPSMLYSFLLPFLHWRKLQNVDFFKTNQMYGSWTAVIARKLFKGILVVRCGYELLLFLKLAKKSYPMLWVGWFVEFIAYQSADAVIISSAKDAAFAQEHFSFIKEKLHVIPNAIDTNRFRPFAEKKEPGSVLFVGRLEPQKNLEALIEAMAGLEGKLWIVGEGSLRRKLEELAQQKGIAVDFKGIVPQAELPLLLNRAEVFILPSLYEGSPKALLEAMACGLPCIAADLPEIRELVRHKDNGYLCTTKADSIANALAALFKDTSLRMRLGKQARVTICESFAFEKIFQKELELYMRYV